MSRWYSDTTQIAWTCEMLVQGEEISHACEFKAVQGWRLAAIIHQLSKKYGWPISHRDGASNIRYYFLSPSAKIKNLHKPESYKRYLEKQEQLKEKGVAAPLPEKSDNDISKSNDSE